MTQEQEKNLVGLDGVPEAYKRYGVYLIGIRRELRSMSFDAIKRLKDKRYGSYLEVFYVGKSSGGLNGVKGEVYLRVIDDVARKTWKQYMDHYKIDETTLVWCHLPVLNPEACESALLSSGIQGEEYLGRFRYHLNLRYNSHVEPMPPNPSEVPIFVAAYGEFLQAIVEADIKAREAYQSMSKAIIQSYKGYVFDNGTGAFLSHLRSGDTPPSSIKLSDQDMEYRTELLSVNPAFVAFMDRFISPQGV